MMLMLNWIEMNHIKYGHHFHQYCSLIIISHIIPCSLFHMAHKLRVKSNAVNELLFFNASLITIAPNVLMLFPVHIVLIIIPFDPKTVICSMYFTTTQIQFSQYTITFQCFTYHSRSFCSNFVVYSFIYLALISPFQVFSIVPFRYRPDPVQSMYYYISMLHLSFLLQIYLTASLFTL